ncbi:Transglutaminase-like superfamily protein [Natronincola peptidivorans]|uniref:Transglutaminase-like superfamily protein n=1 Tax=Natronincola peptidivorans TaxID=426128 RepID=A0A1I0E144_9FIRM|nr:transglutaminase-like domain-containing protein [Natronincola peptidivorans]SET38789.1 Transglutaminase-like superfamily protein [Natronincola peptidivorans]
MGKRVLFILIIFILSTSNVFGQAVIDTNALEQGIIGVQYNNNSSNRTKLMVEKDGNKYTYNINGIQENFSLQMGNGNYKISLLENTEGNKYRVVYNETVVASMQNENNAFTGSVQMIKWDTSMKAIKKAQELVQGAKTDEEKLESIYQYVISNVTYDYEKISGLTSDYLPEIEKIYQENKGICYDYAALVAAMLRSVGVPTKLVMGYAPDVKEYHAWNEVYLESKGQWITIDTTVDAQYIKANQEANMKKNSNLYNKVKEY